MDNDMADEILRLFGLFIMIVVGCCLTWHLDNPFYGMGLAIGVPLTIAAGYAIYCKLTYKEKEDE